MFVLPKTKAPELVKEKLLKKAERSSIKYLNDREVSISEIARVTDHTRKTVRRVLREPTDKEYQRSSMESQVDKYYEEDIKRWIREDEEHPYEGSTSNFYDRVRKIRKEMENEEEAVVRFETLPGEQLQIDWGEANIDYDEKEERKEYFFYKGLSREFGKLRKEQLPAGEDSSNRTTKTLLPHP